MIETLVPLRAIYRRIEERGRPDLQLLSVYRELGVIPREGREDNFNKASDDLSSYKVVRPGDLVLNKMKTWQGSLGVSAYEGIVSPAYFVGRRIATVDNRYMHHLLRSSLLIAEYGARSKGIRPSQWDLPWDEFASIKVALPPLHLQKTIADYLDAETARIDELIAKKQRMVELLEQRFDAEVQFQVEGNLEWPLVHLRWCVAHIADGTHGSYERLSEGMPLLSSKNLKGGTVTVGEDEAWISKQDYVDIVRSCGFRHDDVLLGVIGGSIGNVSRLPSGAPLAFQRSVASLRPSESYSGDFLFFVCKSPRFQDQLILAANSSAQSGVYLGSLGDIAVPLPLLAEQESVAMKLSASYRRMKFISERLSMQITGLTERRQALITAAVTGQLNIQGVAA